MEGYYLYKQQMQRLRAAQKCKNSVSETAFQKQVRWRAVTKMRRRIADKQIIICILVCGLLIMGTGAALTCVGHFVLAGYNPLILVGPVVVGCGVIVLLLSAEVCIRRKKMLQQVDDSGDDLSRHVNPILVPPGYGNSQTGAAAPGSGSRQDQERELAGSGDGKKEDASAEDGARWNAAAAVSSSSPLSKQRATSLPSDILSIIDAHSQHPKVSLTPASPTGPAKLASSRQVEELLLMPSKLAS